MKLFRRRIASAPVALFLLCIPFLAGAQDHEPFHLSDVKLLPGPFLDAQQTDLKYIFSLDVDRLLHPFLREAGLKPKEPSYGNWEGSGLDGHIGGHYLSALSLMFASTADSEAKRRLDYMVDQLERCQERNGNGYVGGIPGGRAMWEEIAQGRINAGSFSLNDKWVPLYNIHKLYAGLYDAYVMGRNEKARQVFIALCDWFVNLTENLSDAQVQEMLKSEHGGMNEIFALAYELTGTKQYLTLSKRLSHQALLAPLLQGEDKLTGLHANTQIPKVVGFQKIASLTNDESWSAASSFFWNTVVSHRTVAIGGNSVREHFHPVTDFSSMIESNQGPETCNTYNMLKLSKGLFLDRPDAKYVDYYERAIFNHILSSQHPERGGFVYFTPMRPRHYRVYSSPSQSFWCCVGSGLENHAKYGELIYSRNKSDLFVNLFIPSVLEWREKKLQVTQKTSFPSEETSVIKLKLAKSSEFTIHVRYPSWVKKGDMKLSVNGKPVRISGEPSSYVSLQRKWKSGDVIQVELPMHPRVEYLPDGSRWASFLYGPLVLAAPTDSTDLSGLTADDSRMGHVAEGAFLPVDETPVVLKTGTGLSQYVRSVPGKPLAFSLENVVFPAAPRRITLVPFHTVHDSRYIVYWPVATPEELEVMKQKLKEKEDSVRMLHHRTIDEVYAGEQQPEVEHLFDGAQTETGVSHGKQWRSASGWFSYSLEDRQHKGAVLRVVYNKPGYGRRFNVFVNDIRVQTEAPSDSHEEGTLVVDYPIEINSTGKVLVKFVAHENARTSAVHSVHLLRE